MVLAETSLRSHLLLWIQDTIRIMSILSHINVVEHRHGELFRQIVLYFVEKSDLSGFVSDYQTL